MAGVSTHTGFHTTGRRAPRTWKSSAGALTPDPGDYRHHASGEDDGDAHFKNPPVIVPVTRGRLDPATVHAELDGRRDERPVIEVLGK